MHLRLLSTWLLVGCVSSVFAASDYHVVARHLIGGEAWSYDYIRVDALARRAYVAHEKQFEVVDADTGKIIGVIGPVARAHGVALVPEAGHGFATSGIDDRILMFDLATLKVLKDFHSSGSNPDAIEYDVASKRVYAANHGSGDITVIDIVSGDIVGTISVGGKLEGMAFDGYGHGYVNAEDVSTVRVFDTKTLKLIASWPVAPGEGGTGLGIDGERHRLFSACANSQVVVLDSESGKVIATPSAGEDPDGLTFDAKTHRIFTSNPAGTISVIQQTSANEYTPLTPVLTTAGTKTLGFDEKTGRIFTAAANFGPKPAAVKGGPKPRAPILAGTFELIVVGQE